VYDGEFIHGTRYGKGIYTSLNEDYVYEGEWKNGKPNGKGEERNAKGNILFKGEWENGMRVETLEDGDLICSICFEKKADHCFIPCGHLCICKHDAEEMKDRENNECPICRKEFTDIVKIFPVGKTYNKNENNNSVPPPK